MGTVITLRSHTPITVKASPRQRVRIRVSDRAFPESTRGDVQRPVQNAADSKLSTGSMISALDLGAGTLLK
ncbi:hypothetical protein [Ensifer aridi]|uniref:hypothetical protein n=1 Tax=Ensifer aridi TaxID=1708715 RepID=UPI00111164BE|nr:hypothetical protein [Ensifer aridi]